MKQALLSKLQSKLTSTFKHNLIDEYNISEIAGDTYYDDKESIMQLSKAGQKAYDKLLRKAIIDAIPKTFLDGYDYLQDYVSDIEWEEQEQLRYELQKAEAAEKKKQDAITKKQAKAKRDAFIKSLSAEQKKTFKEIVKQ